VNPAAEYSNRLQSRTAAHHRYERLHRRIGNIRLAVGIAAVAIGFFVFGTAAISPWWLVAPVVVFIALAVVHARIIAQRERASRAVRFFERGIERLEYRWMGRGETGERYRAPNHVYADDLDVFGHGSLFELLCTARTQAGEATLAQWLQAPASSEEVTARQKAIAELRDKIDLREELAAFADVVRSEVNPDALAVWGEKPPVLFPHGTRLLVSIVASCVVVIFSLYMADVVNRVFFLAAILVESCLGFALRPKVKRIIEDAEHPARDLDLLSGVVSCIEAQTFESELLRRVRLQLETKGEPASRQIRRLHTLISRLDDRGNQFFAPIAAAVMWGTQFAMAVENWRLRSGGSIRRWLLAVGEFEALCSFAAHSFEHPADPFPILSDRRAWFDAQGLGHPLMPENAFVSNDVRLGGACPLLIISGSNMSGKSTLLRSVGLNTVLAWAGAPVRATRLELSPLQVGASIRIVDSLLDGKSRFYAEIMRLRQIMDLAGQERTLVFLVDEILSGTNSHDRRIGAEALVRTLVDRGAIGLITTHDLALAHIADGLGSRASNMHFSDTILDGKLNFDYHLRPGVVEHSNALELMRSVGLDV
jgi:MutS domain V